MQDVCDEIERDAGAAAQSLVEDELTPAQLADLYDQLIPVYQHALALTSDLPAPSPDLEDDLRDLRLSIGETMRQMTAERTDLPSVAEPLNRPGPFLQRTVDRNQTYAQALGVGPCGLGELPAEVPPAEVSAHDVDVLRTTCAHFESRLADSLPIADDASSFLSVLLGAVLDAQTDVGALENNDLKRTFARSLRDFEDDVLADSRGKMNSQQLLQYRDAMAAVRTLLQRYGVKSSCRLDFTAEDFTTAPAAT